MTMIRLWRNWRDRRVSQDDVPMRALDVEALVWSAMTRPAANPRLCAPIAIGESQAGHRGLDHSRCDSLQ